MAIKMDPISMPMSIIIPYLDMTYMVYLKRQDGLRVSMILKAMRGMLEEMLSIGH